MRTNEPLTPAYSRLVDQRVQTLTGRPTKRALATTIKPTYDEVREQVKSELGIIGRPTSDDYELFALVNRCNDLQGFRRDTWREFVDGLTHPPRLSGQTISVANYANMIVNTGTIVR